VSNIKTLGSIGTDKQGTWIKDQLAKENIKHAIFEAQNEKTGECAVTVVDADRTCIAVLDACLKYPTSHLAGILDTEDSAYCFYTTGFFVEVNYEASLLMAQYAFENNKVFGFNFAADYLYADFKQEMLKCIEYSNFIFCNREEAFACAAHLHVELGLETEESKRD